jgi:RNA polymerase sigma factor (sigma-70 family)
MLTVNMPSPALSRSDEGLLQAFAGSGSQEAFGALVTKYLGMVLGIATRRTGDRALAEEIAQNVFAILARKAGGLNCGATLGGWIHRVTVIECADALRRRQSHQAKMNVVSQQLLSELDGREVWQDAMPLLDDAIDALNPAEREVVLLRFFEGKSFREIGTALGKTDDAAQKQVDRALQKISAYLKGKGVTVPAAVLAADSPANSRKPRHLPWPKAIAHGAITTASTFNAKILILQALEAMTNTKLKTALFATAALAVPITMQWAENNRLREALDQAQQQRVPLAAAGYASDPAENFARSAAGLTASVSGSGADLASPAGSSSPGGLVHAKEPANVAQEWEQVLFIADPLQRSQRLSELLGALTAEDAPHIAEAFEHAKTAGIEFADEQRLFLRGWGKVGGAAAVEYAVNHGGQASDGAVAALGGWATAAPRDARVWLEALPESNSKETLVYGLLDGWSTSDFQAAAAYAESRPASPAQGSFRELLLQRALRAGGIAAAQSWVYRIADNAQNGDYKKRAFSGVVQAMLYRDPAAAARWIQNSTARPLSARTL